MLNIENISIQYKSKQENKQVIDRLSFQLESGEALAILGQSGCGKSTLINALSGTLPANQGSIYFKSKDQTMELNPKIHRIGLIPQNCGLLPWKTVKDNCRLALKLRKNKIDFSMNQEMNLIYQSLNIVDILNKYPRELSGGQVQRAAIARAFIMKPDLLLMDEPFSALDAITREEARELFLRMWGQQKPTTILVTHSIEEALYLGSKIFVMDVQNGQFKFKMDNPYFGKMNPQTVEYLDIKYMLKEQLMHKKIEVNSYA